MTSPVSNLRRMLVEKASSLTTEGRLLSTDGIENMRKIVERLRRKLGDRPAMPSKARICHALRKMRETGAASLDGMEFWFACWGLTERCPNQSLLIEDHERFEDFINEVKKRNLTTLAWQGLLDTYFRYPPPDSGTGRKNWLYLRSWLSADLPSLRHRTSSLLLPLLDWLSALSDNPTLLTDEPCKPYAAEALRGERNRIDRLKSVLGIVEASWFWKRLIMSQIDEACSYQHDSQFKACLDSLISQLKEHPTEADQGLAKLLNRYAKCTERSPHEGLKQFSVERWGSPQLVMQAKWSLVSPPAKEMVSQWLILEDLRDFFGLLLAGGVANQRRLDFWLRFIKQISLSHIVLGTHLWWDRNWIAFRKRKTGRISRLDGGGGSKNAFIVKIKNYYFVEFGETGDACYGYIDSNKPFEIGSGLMYYPGDLKDRGRNIFPGRHFDGRKRWEQKFLEDMAKLGIRPD